MWQTLTSCALVPLCSRPSRKAPFRIMSLLPVLMGSYRFGHAGKQVMTEGKESWGVSPQIPCTFQPWGGSCPS